MDSSGCGTCPLLSVLQALMKHMGFKKRKELVYHLIYYQLLKSGLGLTNMDEFQSPSNLTHPKLT
jgi:hypothetical protein